VIKKNLQNIFKKFAYNIFIIFHGKIDNSIKPNDHDKIKTNVTTKEEDINYKVYKIENGRLYTDRIHDTAVIIDNKIIEGPSFQFRRTNDSIIYNSKIDENIAFTKGTPRKMKKLDGTVLSLLTGGGGNDNYWHWMFDVLPRISLCSDFYNLEKIDYFLFPNLEKNFQTDTLDLLEIPKQKRISSVEYRHIKSENIILTDHPVLVTGNASNDNNNQPAWISKWYRNFFEEKKILTKEKKKKNFYIDRDDDSNRSAQRAVSNNNEVKKYLMKENFIVVKLHKMNFLQQANLFYNAECIVGLHGAGFANLVFSDPGTKIIELRSSISGNSIKNICKKNNLIYKPIIVNSKKIDNFNFPNQHGSFEIPVETLKEKIEN